MFFYMKNIKKNIQKYLKFININDGICFIDETT